MRYWIDLCETVEPDGFLYHVTPKTDLLAITSTGVRPGSYWGTMEIADYYAKVIEEDGGEPVFIRASVSVFTESKLRPDKPGLEEPITTVIGKSKEEIWEAWESSNKTWKDCLDLIGSVQYMKVMHLPPAEVKT